MSLSPAQLRSIAVTEDCVFICLLKIRLLKYLLLRTRIEGMCSMKARLDGFKAMLYPCYEMYTLLDIVDTNKQIVLCDEGFTYTE